jgi:hypothetical protein
VKGKVGTPAYHGQMLHTCLEVFANNRINLKKSFDVSYKAGLDMSKELGVLAQYSQMDKKVMDFLTERAKMVMTEIPLVYDGDTKKVRRDTYMSAGPGDVLVGTADLIVENKDGSFTIADWKTGLDDVDGASDNDQLAGLAWMARQFFGFETFYLAVLNPVTKEADLAGPFTDVTFDYQRYLDEDWSRESAGDHCRYCPLKKNCESYMTMIRKELVNAGFQDPLVGAGQRDH